MEFYDSLKNLLSGFGTSKDRTTQTVVEQPWTLSSSDLEVLYRNNHYASRVVDLLPDESTRRGFTVAVEGDAPTSNPFESDFVRLGLMPKMNQADKWARLYGGAALILGIDDGRDPSEPVDFDSIQSIDFAYVVDRWSLTSGDLETDPESPGFGLPATYTVTYTDIANDDAIVGMTIHASRMIRFQGVDLPPSLRADQDYWGDPILQRVFESLGNLGMIEKAMGNIVQTFNQPVFKMAGLRQLAKAKNGTTELMSRIEAANLGQSLLGMFLIDSDGESFEKTSTNVSGLDGLYDRIAQSFGAAAGMPLTLLFGTPPAGLSTDDQAGSRNWLNKVRAHQEIAYIPGVQYVAELIAYADPEISNESKVIVTANPLHEPTEQEQAATMKTMAEFSAILIDRGVLTSQEVRESFFGAAKFRGEILIEAEDQAARLADRLDQAAAVWEITEMEAPLVNNPDDYKPGRVAKSRVAYVPETGSIERCSNCGWYVPEVGGCQVVNGQISSEGWCQLWGTKMLRGS